MSIWAQSNQHFLEYLSLMLHLYAMFDFLIWRAYKELVWELGSWKLNIQRAFSEVHLGPHQASTTARFAKIVNGQNPLSIFAKVLL